MKVKLESGLVFLKKWWKLLLIALVLRVVLGGLLYHTDIKAIYRDARYMDLGVAGGYEQAVKDNSSLLYPPLTYVFFNKYQKVGPFSEQFDLWMNDWSSTHTDNNSSLFADLLAMKLPMLVADFLIGVILICYFKEEKKKKLAGLLWFFNPLTIYAIYGIGQYDVLAVLFLTLAGWKWSKGRKTKAYLLVGVASMLKQFSLMLLPLMFFLEAREIKRKTIDLGLGLLLFGAGLMMVIKSRIALTSVFLGNFDLGMFKAGWDLGGKEFLPIYMIWFVLVLMAALTGYFKNLGLYGGMVLLWGGVLGLSHFHPQWVVWIIPSLIILLVEKVVEGRFLVLASLAYFGVVFLINDKFVGLGMFKGINNAFDSLEPLRWWLDKVGAGQLIQSFFHALLLVCILWLVGQIIGAIKVGDTRYKERFDLRQIIIGYLTLFLFLWVGGHVLLARKGKYIDSEYMEAVAVVEINDDGVIMQKIRVVNDGFKGLQVRAKNVDYGFKGKVKFDLIQNGQIIRSTIIDGRSIGDDFDVEVKFDRIANSKDQEYLLKITVEQGELAFQFDPGGEGFFEANDEEVLGKLAYRGFYNPGGIKENMKVSLNNVWKKW